MFCFCFGTIRAFFPTIEGLVSQLGGNSKSNYLFCFITLKSVSRALRPRCWVMPCHVLGRF